MDLIYGKCVQTAILGFVVAGGLHAWSTRISALPWHVIAKESILEGARTSKLLVIATATAGSASLLQYGRYSPRLFELRGEPITAGASAFAAVLSWNPQNGNHGFLHRGGTALIAGTVAAVVSNLMK